MTTFRAPREDDVPALMRLRNDLPTQYALLASPTPNDAGDVRAWIVRRTADPATMFFVIAGDDDGAAIGFTQLVGIDDRSRHGMFGIAIDAAHRGRGHGRAAIEHVARAALASGRVDKIVLHVDAASAAARALYRSTGFVDVGVHRRHYRGPDGWRDVAVMERFLVPVS